MGQILVANIVLVLKRLGLGKNEQIVFLTMALHVLDEAQNGRPAGLYWASRKRLLSDTGLSGTAVTVALASLVRVGWLIRESDGKPGRTANYRIPIDRIDALVAEAKREMAKSEKTGNPSIRTTGNPSIQSTGNRIANDSIHDSTEEERASAPGPRDLLSSEPQPTKGCLKHPNNDAEVSCTACMKQRRDVYEPWAAREQARKAALAKLPGDAPELYREHEHKWTASGHCTKPWCPETNPAVLAA